MNVHCVLYRVMVFSNIFYIIIINYRLSFCVCKGSYILFIIVIAVYLFTSWTMVILHVYEYHN